MADELTVGESNTDSTEDKELTEEKTSNSTLLEDFQSPHASKDSKGDTRKHESPGQPDDLPPKRAKVDSSCKRKSSIITRSCSASGMTSNKDIPSVSVPESPSGESVYKVKWVYHAGKMCPIITQNENGPCPLIGIINVLFLRGKLKLSEVTVEITEEELVEHIRQAVLNTMPKGCRDHNPNHLQNVQDAVALLPLLKTGLNVNVKFTGVKNFEYTPECIIFDLLDIHLYHGWLLDPQSPETMAAVCNFSYNQLVEAILDKKLSKDPVKVAEAVVAEQFLESTASQLTYHGLCELNAALKMGEMAVLFRNNHFSVLYKHEDILCQLVTDQGFLDEKHVVWETLSTINGDETFLDGSFRSSVDKVPSDTYSSLHVIEEQQISQDFLVALSLQDEQNKQQDKEFGWDAYDNVLGAIGMTSDEEIARRLYVEEQRMALVSVSSSPSEEGTVVSQQASSSQTKQQPSPPAPKDPDDPHMKQKDWKCTIA